MFLIRSTQIGMRTVPALPKFSDIPPYSNSSNRDSVNSDLLGGSHAASICPASQKRPIPDIPDQGL